MKYTAKQVIKAVKDSHGILTAVAERLGCNRTTVYDYAKRYLSVQKAIDEERDVIIDKAEDTLFKKAIQDEDTTSLIFLLKTVGKRRGYIERQERDVNISNLSEWLAQGFEEES